MKKNSVSKNKLYTLAALLAIIGLLAFFYRLTLPGTAIRSPSWNEVPFMRLLPFP